MIPEQRVSRRTQALENMALDPGVGADQFDDFGIPTKPRGSTASGGKKSGLFTRFRRSQTTGALADSDDDDNEGFDVIQNASTHIYGAGPPPGAGAGFMMPQQLANASDPGTAHHGPSPSADLGGEISMDQLSSLRDRHRYPAINEEPKAGRAMSLTSMSSYDTTPVIPMLGPVHTFQSGSSHNKVNTQTDKYRQRMIESRRALLSSETGIPISGNPNAPRPAPPGDRTMSLASVSSANSRQVPYQRSNTMSSQASLGYPPHMGYPPQGFPPSPGYPPQGFPQGYPPQGYPPQGYPPQGFPGQPLPQGFPGQPPQGYPGPGPQGYAGAGPYAPGTPGPPAPPNGQWRRQGPAAGPGSPAPPLQNRTRPLPPLNGTPDGAGDPGTAASPRPSEASFTATPRVGPPMETPQLDGPGGSPEGPVGTPKSFPLDTVPRVGLQHQISEQSDFDFGQPGRSAEQKPADQPPAAGSHAKSPSPAAEAAAADNAALRIPNEEYEEKLRSLQEDVRVMSIELAESARRQLALDPAHEDTSTIAALAKAQAELALERTRREAVEKAARNRGVADVDLHEKVAELEYHHAEAVHLLSIRSGHYDKLTQDHSALNEAFAKITRENGELAAKVKAAEGAAKVQEQQQQLAQQVQTLEEENAKLRAELSKLSKRGPLSERVTALEDQRAALQEALRAMRERKDAEIQHLNTRIEALAVGQRRIRTASAASAGSGGPASAGSMSLSAGDGAASHPASLYSRSNPITPTGKSSEDEGGLLMPRLRDIGRPASPLHIGLDYSR